MIQENKSATRKVEEWKNPIQTAKETTKTTITKNFKEKGQFKGHME